MLYVTTRGVRDAFTAHRTLCTDKAPDNGCFIPMQFPQFSDKEIRSFTEQPFEETVAHILNVFFSVGLTKWDVGLCVGRNTARISEKGTRIYFAELWHNPGNCFKYLVDELFLRIFGKKTVTKPSEWFCLAVKISVLFGLYGELCQSSLLTCGNPIDLSLPADDFSYPMAALYARNAGLPIGNIVCNCAQTREVWNLIHRGVFNTSGMSENLKAGLERFIQHRVRPEGVTELQENQSFEAQPEERVRLCNDLFCVVSGVDRILSTLNSFYSRTAQVITPDAALCIAGLGDYRAKTGESRYTLILEEDSPVLFGELIEKATGISGKKLGEYLRE